MKRAIYLDERERDLAQRVFETCRSEIQGEVTEYASAKFRNLACQWTADEITNLALKFYDAPDDELVADKAKGGAS